MTRFRHIQPVVWISALIALNLLAAGYMIFLKHVRWDELYVHKPELRQPEGFLGTFVTAVALKGPGSNSNFFRLNHQDNHWEQLSTRQIAYARISPVSESIAYCDGQNVRSPGLFILDRGGEEKRIGDISGRPVWSPDGRWIICTDLGNGSQSHPGKGTWKFQIDGSTQTQLPLLKSETVYDWSPDGRWFLIGQINKSKTLYSLAAATNLTSRIPIEFDEQVLWPRFTHQPDQLVFVIRPPDGPESIVMRKLTTTGQTIALNSQSTTVYTLAKDELLEDFSLSVDDKFLAIAAFDKRTIAPGTTARGNLELINLQSGSRTKLNVSGIASAKAVALR